MTLNQIGLLLNILGTVTIFFFGLPQKLQDTEDYIERGSLTKQQVRINRKTKLFAFLGLTFLFIGFVLQFFDTLTNRNDYP
jgi:uncharacterized membrane protein